MTQYFVWDIDRIIFSIPLLFGLEIPIRWYSVTFLIGILGAAMLVHSMFMAEKKSPRSFEFLPFYIIIGTMLGARLAHVFVYNFSTYMSNPLKIFYVWEGGLASHGGFLFVILALVLYSRKHRQEFSFFWLVDRCAIAAMFAAGCIRIGNFFNSEIIGLPTNVPWAVVFARVDDLPRHPTQIYESLGYFYICLSFYIFYRIKNRNIGEGRFFGAILISGFLYRAIVERFKENHTEIVNDLSMNMGQMLSIPFILMGIYLVLGFHLRSKWWSWGLSTRRLLQ
ncbi:MAG: prolipoprotein diacylglyceryl transferase [Proteobacteria bacterium]|nr:prolipoprotein diacylglyceryl transferase [Pseudomonadota bacterium]